MIAVSETFYSIQGEGKTIGVPSVFVRLGGCNLMCGGFGTQFDNQLHAGATWRCDTIEVWMQAKRKSFPEIFTEEYVHAIKNGAHIIITGGEPLIQMQAICEMIKYVRSTIHEGAYIEIETNGTIMPSEELQTEVQQWNVSPKLSNSGNEKQIRINVAALQTFSSLQNVQFKFVISSEDDYKEMERDFYFIPYEQICLMPAGSSQSELEETRKVVADICKNNFLKMTDRLHIAVWNQKTGV